MLWFFEAHFILAFIQITRKSRLNRAIFGTYVSHEKKILCKFSTCKSCLFKWRSENKFELTFGNSCKLLMVSLIGRFGLFNENKKKPFCQWIRFYVNFVIRLNLMFRRRKKNGTVHSCIANPIRYLIFIHSKSFLDFIKGHNKKKFGLFLFLITFLQEIQLMRLLLS